MGRGLKIKKAHVLQDEPQRMKALVEYMDMQKLQKEKEVLQLQLQKEKEVLQKENQQLQRGLLQVQGLLTSRGLFECVAQLAFDEQVSARYMRGKFNCSETLKQVPESYDVGQWSTLLRQTIRQCAPRAKTKAAKKQELQAVWDDLSKAIHHPWYGPDVQIVSALSQTGKCVITKLATALRLEVKETRV